MDIQSLITTVPKGSKPFRLEPDQFELMIDRANRKVSHPVVGFLLQKEMVRMQTNRPYQCSLTLSLPDMTGGTLREIACSVVIEGNVNKTPEGARSFVEAALLTDFDFKSLFLRLLARAVAEFSSQLVPQGTFVRALRTTPGLTQMQRHLLDVLCQARLFATRVVVTPLASDGRLFITLEDAANSLEIRPKDQLRAQRIGYKARLSWGKEEEQVVGRLSYRGKVEGREQAAPLPHPAVAGQLQPLEAWFCLLLGNALSQQTWHDICAADPSTMATVRQAVSTALGRGTGRVVQDLVVYPAIDQGSTTTESTTRFLQRYPIAGMKGEGLEVDHAIRFTLVDLSRWEACKSPEPQAFLKQQVIDATRSYLLDKRFEDVVALYLSGKSGEEDLRKAIEDRVASSARTIGHQLGSVATILTIPQMDFVQGRAIVFPERSYQLATAHLAPAITIRTRLKIRQQEGGGIVFARALARDDDFDERVRGVIEDIVRNQLRGVSALQYYASHYVNGVGAVQNAESGEWVSAASGEGQFQREMREALDASLAAKFGLETVEFDLVPGADPLIERMRKLTRLPITYEEELQFERGDSRTMVRLHAHATLFVASIDTQHWDSFYLNAMRLPEDEHERRIKQTLRETLKLLEGLAVEGGNAAFRETGAKEMVIQWFARRMSEELGLVVRLRPLVLRVLRPKVGQVADVIVRSLETELVNLLARRQVVDDERGGGGYHTRNQMRDSLTARIKQVRSELAEAAAEQESDIGSSEVVLIEQHPITGRLLETANGARESRT